jgi:hypothetical protein
MSVSRVCWLVIKRPTFMRPSSVICTKTHLRADHAKISSPLSVPRASSASASNRTRACAHVSLDHLVSARHQCRGHRHAHRISGLEIDHQLKLGGLFDRDVGNLDAAEELDELSGHYL